jgi:hypothetical protein
LLYNFNLQIGEEFQVGNYPLLKILSIDSIALNSGEKRKRLEIAMAAYPDVNTYWIEGVGSLRSPMNTRFMFTLDCWNSLNCFHINDVVEYQLGSCVLATSDNLKPQIPTIACYPNPAEDQINFTISDDNKVEQIQIIDFQGKTMIQLTEQQERTIDISAIPQSIYLVKVVYKDGTVGSAKFVVK